MFLLLLIDVLFYYAQQPSFSFLALEQPSARSLLVICTSSALDHFSYYVLSSTDMDHSAFQLKFKLKADVMCSMKFNKKKQGRLWRNSNSKARVLLGVIIKPTFPSKLEEIKVEMTRKDVERESLGGIF